MANIAYPQMRRTSKPTVLVVPGSQYLSAVERFAAKARSSAESQMQNRVVDRIVTRLYANGLSCQAISDYLRDLPEEWKFRTLKQVQYLVNQWKKAK